MAVIRPFRAVMPSHVHGEDVTDRVAPPYDVISPELRQDLLGRHLRNVVALELPEGPLDPNAPDSRYETGRERWREWRAEGALCTDDSEAVYVLEQRFDLDGRAIRRRCLMASVDLEPYDAGVVLPHERTLPKALDDRLNMIRATEANLSPVFAMFSDPDGDTDRFFEAATSQEPMMRATDDDGVQSIVWALRDSDLLEELGSALADRAIFIADGHHRYTTALAYRDETRGEASDGWQARDAVMMALVNMDDPNLVVLPTHRVADAPGDFDPVAFRESLAELFDLTDPGPEPTDALARADRPAFVIRTPGDGVVVAATLRDDVDPVDAIGGDHSDEWKGLDVAVLQELVLDPLLDIHPDRAASLDRLSFAKDAGRALVIDDHDVVFLLRPTRMDQLRSVALAGETMPQKSTYFYPKLLSGLLMRALD